MKISMQWFGWIVFAVVLFNVVAGLKELNKQWDRKIKSQRQNNYQVTTSAQQWDELEDFRNNWGKYFDEEKEASSSRHQLFTKLRLEQSGLTPSITKIVSSESETLSHNNLPVDLSQTCVGNTASGLSVKAENVKVMLSALRSLRDRQSVTFGDLTLLNKKGYPEVVIRDLCVLFRLGDPS